MDDYPYPLPMLLDGDTPAGLEEAGMPAGVCVEKWALEHPEILQSLQREFIAAGAQAVLAPTLGANRACLSAYGLEDETVRLNAGLIRLTRETAAAHNVAVGGIVGPSGLFAEPFGETDFDDLYDLYREQIRALDEAGAQLLFIESQSSLADMRAAVLAARTTNLPVFVSLCVDAAGHTLTGGSLLPTVITLQAMGVEAIGLNGSAGPGSMLEHIREAAAHALVPLLARPELSRPDLSPQEFAQEMRPLLEAGVRIVGGCRGVSPRHIAALSPLLQGFAPLPAPEEPDCHAAAIESEAFFLGEDIVLSEPIPCTAHLDEDFIDLEDDRSNAALVVVESIDDARLLARNSGMARQAIAVHCDSRPVLDAALRYFQGRLIVDSDCSIEEEALLPLIKKYGAIYY